MKQKSRAKFWMIMWIISISVGSLFSAILEIIFFFKNGFFRETPPYAAYQVFLLLIFVPFLLLPMLCMACYHAIQEKNKAVKIVSIFLIMHHMICVTAVFLQLLTV